MKSNSEKLSIHYERTGTLTKFPRPLCAGIERRRQRETRSYRILISHIELTVYTGESQKLYNAYISTSLQLYALKDELDEHYKIHDLSFSRDIFMKIFLLTSNY